LRRTAWQTKKRQQDGETEAEAEAETSENAGSQNVETVGGPNQTRDVNIEQFITTSAVAQAIGAVQKESGEKL
jgi:hypothetical protein